MNLKTDKLRKKYLEFFKKKNHKVFVSDTLVSDDASLLFTSAGMNQFKSYFLGEKKDIARAVSCQKCLRTGDLEKVGQTAYHHTFFEMLGNFSFGDYFKKEAIDFAWEFVTKELSIDKNDLWVSVYKDDKEAYQIWKDKINVPEERIVKLGADSNFWPANAPSDGPNGPCGPCSEIFFDRGESVGCRKKECNPDCSCGRFVEVWNLVFTQFNRVGPNKLEPLPQKNIDTGMGLERMAAVLQGKASNFEIDILQPAVNLVRKILKTKEGADSSVNAIVDHARAAIFAIADGIYPSNEGRGYVIRKIIRRALLKARGLGNRQPFLFKLAGLFAKVIGSTYPEIKQKKDNISKIIASEEEKYFAMIREGEAQVAFIKKLTPEDAFRLYDTYGLPLEIIKEFAAERGFRVDDKKFEVLFKEQQERSRKKSMFDEDIFKKAELDLSQKTEFIGHELTESEVIIEQVFSDQGLIILNKTPFYPESGGPLSDQGIIRSKSGEFKVEKVFKVNEAIVHKGRVVKGRIEQGPATAFVDTKRREALARSHTATHLLQAALRKVLGEHVIQQGSLVDEDNFRFDFTHFNRLADAEKKAVEDLVRKFIKSAEKVEKKELNLEEAKKQGALAFFKDKYQDRVRVVSISDYSKELCGGMHVNNTAEVNDFEIERESSISSGIRRIRASVGKKAQEARNIKKKTTEAIKKEKKTDKARIAEVNIEDTRGSDSNIKGVNVSVREFEPKTSPESSASRAALLLCDRIKQKIGSGIVFVATRGCEKDIFICSATDDIINKGFSCKKFISKFGRALSLTGGGSDRIVRGLISGRSDDFIRKVEKAISKSIKK